MNRQSNPSRTAPTNLSMPSSFSLMFPNETFETVDRCAKKNRFRRIGCRSLSYIPDPSPVNRVISGPEDAPCSRVRAQAHSQLVLRCTNLRSKENQHYQHFLLFKGNNSNGGGQASSRTTFQMQWHVSNYITSPSLFGGQQPCTRKAEIPNARCNLCVYI